MTKEEHLVALWCFALILRITLHLAAETCSVQSILPSQLMCVGGGGVIDNTLIVVLCITLHLVEM